MPKIYNYPGDYILKSLTLENFEGKTKEIHDFMRTLEFTEDIFENVIFGTVFMVDGIDLVQYFPIVGQEKLTFKYSVDDEETITREFYVYKVSNKQQQNNQMSSYQLNFCSKEAFENENQVIQKAFKGKTSDLVVEHALRSLRTSKKLNKDASQNPLHVISPRWSPLELINWCTTVSLSQRYEGSLFLFYENKDGFNFKHLESLYDQDPAIELEAKLEGIQASKDQGEELQPGVNIQVVRIVKNQNTLKQIQDGMFAGKVVGYDNITKEIREYDYDYEKQFAAFSHLGKSELNRNFGYKSTAQRISSVPTTTFRGDSAYFARNEGTAFSKKHEETYRYRSSQLSQLEGLQLQLKIYGNLKVSAGYTVNLTIPNITTLQDKQDQKEEKYIRGKALIVSCSHNFTQKKYEQSLTCAKDSLAASIETDLV